MGPDGYVVNLSAQVQTLRRSLFHSPSVLRGGVGMVTFAATRTAHFPPFFKSAIGRQHGGLVWDECAAGD